MLIKFYLRLMKQLKQLSLTTHSLKGLLFKSKMDEADYRRYLEDKYL